MPRGRVLAIAVPLLWAGCSGGPPPVPRHEDEPPENRRVEEMLQISERPPARWSPALTIPLYPVLLAADTSIKFAVGTHQWVIEQVSFLQRLLFGDPTPPAPPDALDRAAESWPKR